MEEGIQQLQHEQHQLSESQVGNDESGQSTGVNNNNNNNNGINNSQAANGPSFSRGQFAWVSSRFESIPCDHDSTLNFVTNMSELNH